MNETLFKKASQYLNTFCVEIKDRSVGSSGNVSATDFFEKQLSSYGWRVEKSGLDVMDWDRGIASLSSETTSFDVDASPYSNGCDTGGELVSISSADDLEAADLQNKIVLLHGEIAREQIMPKNFIFYNPDSHKRIVSLLEKSGVQAIICATGRNSALAGGVYPFPMIEDGDFNIPSVYMKDTEGERLLRFAGKHVAVKSSARRHPSKAFNISGYKGDPGLKRLTVTAHIDAKKGTPGAIDNATGVVILLLVAEILQNYSGKYLLEIAALNGEDYYAVPGQMDFIRKNEGKFGNIALNINIDGAGFIEGDTALSFYGVPDEIRRMVTETIRQSRDISEGPEWPQGDHSIFVQFGVPAIAVSSMWLTCNMDNQSVTHTEKDRPEIVDIRKTVRTAEMIAEIITRISRT